MDFKLIFHVHSLPSLLISVFTEKSMNQTPQLSHQQLNQSTRPNKLLILITTQSKQSNLHNDLIPFIRNQSKTKCPCDVH